MREVKVRKDSEWTSIDGALYEATAKVLDAREVDGIGYVTYLRSSKYAGRSVRTLTQETFLRTFEKKSDFYRVGRVYKYNWASVLGATYHIQEVYQVSKPVHPGLRRQARAVAIDSNDKREMVMLDGDDFKSMKEVTS